MGSAWGKSWGSSWGNSWGTISDVEEEEVVIEPSGGGSYWRDKKLREQIEHEDEIVLSFVTAFFAVAIH